MRPLAFLILAAVTLSTAVAALVVTATDRPRLATADPGAPMFPDLAGRAADVATIRIETSAGVATLRRGSERWGLAEQGGYPVASGGPERLIGALADMAQVEPKTDDPGRLGRLGLADDGEGKARGRRVTLSDAGGRPVLDVVLGHDRPGLYGERADGLFVRRAGESRAWLVLGTVAIPAEPDDWIDRTVVDVDGGSVLRLALVPKEGPAVVALREAAGQPLRLQTVPDGYRASDPARLQAIAGALQGLDFTAARPASDPPPGARPSGSASATTQDGLTVRLRLLADGDATWAAVSAAADPIAAGGAAAVKEAEDRAATIVRRTGGWLYRLPPTAGERLATTLDSLVEPVPPDGS